MLYFFLLLTHAISLISACENRMQPFRSAVCGTQAFAEFLSQRCVATAWADPEVLLFDAIVEARAAGKQARLLSNARFDAPAGREVLLVSSAAEPAVPTADAEQRPFPPPARRYREAYERALDDEEAAATITITAAAAGAASTAVSAVAAVVASAAAGASAEQSTSPSEMRAAATGHEGTISIPAASPPARAPDVPGSGSKRRSSHWLSPRDRVAAFRAAHLLPDETAGSGTGSAAAAGLAIGIWSPFSDGDDAGSDADGCNSSDGDDDDDEQRIAAKPASSGARKHSSGDKAPMSPGPELDIALSPSGSTAGKQQTPEPDTTPGAADAACARAAAASDDAAAGAGAAALEALGSGRITVRQRRRGRARALSKRESAVMQLVMQALSGAATTATTATTAPAPSAGYDADYPDNAPLPRACDVDIADGGADTACPDACAPEAMLDDKPFAAAARLGKPASRTALAALDDAASAGVSNRSLASLNLGMSNRTIPSASVSGVSNRSLASLNLGCSERTSPAGTGSVSGSVVSHGTLASLDLGISNRSIADRIRENGGCISGRVVDAALPALTGSKRRRGRSTDGDFDAGADAATASSAAANCFVDGIAAAHNGPGSAAAVHALLSPRSAAAEAAARAWPRVDAALASPMLGAAGASKRKRLLAAEAAAEGGAELAAEPAGDVQVVVHPAGVGAGSRAGSGIEAAATGIDSDDSDGPGSYLDAPPRRPLHRRSFVLDGSAGPAALLHSMLDEPPAATRTAHRPRPSLLPLPTCAFSDFVAGRGICDEAKSSAASITPAHPDVAALLAENRRLAAELRLAHSEIARLRECVATLNLSRRD